jgi:hypothetical protein
MGTETTLPREEPDREAADPPCSSFETAARGSVAIVPRFSQKLIHTVTDKLSSVRALNV